MLEAGYLPFGSPPNTVRRSLTLPLFVFLETCSLHTAKEIVQAFAHIKERIQLAEHR